MIKNDKPIGNNVLKILVVNDVFPHIRNSTTILFENIVPLIKKKLEVKVFWVITDNYGERTKVTDPNYEVFYLSDYKNAREILEKIKPDLCYHLAGASVLDYAFMLVERHLKIPNFGLAAGWGEGTADFYFREEVFLNLKPMSILLTGINNAGTFNKNIIIDHVSRIICCNSTMCFSKFVS